MAAHLRYRINIYNLKENRVIQPRTLGWLIATSLYARRFSPFFIEPIVAGLDDNNEPYLCTTDSIGCICDGDDFFCIGTGSEMLLGACESFYRPNLEPDDLFETAAQCFLSGLDRDAFSGWGAVVFIISPSGITAKTVKTRMD